MRVDCCAAASFPHLVRPLIHGAINACRRPNGAYNVIATRVLADPRLDAARRRPDGAVRARVGRDPLHPEQPHRRGRETVERARLDPLRPDRPPQGSRLPAGGAARRRARLHAVPVPAAHRAAGHHPAGSDRLCVRPRRPAARPGPGAGRQPRRSRLPGRARLPRRRRPEGPATPGAARGRLRHQPRPVRGRDQGPGVRPRAGAPRGGPARADGGGDRAPRRFRAGGDQGRGRSDRRRDHPRRPGTGRG